jgi:hypothetical protein
MQHTDVRFTVYSSHQIVYSNGLAFSAHDPDEQAGYPYDRASDIACKTVYYTVTKVQLALLRVVRECEPIGDRIGQQPSAPQPLEHARRAPCFEAIMDGAGCAERAR